MASFYLLLALVLAISINHRRAGVRAAGSAIAALGLVMIASSIVLANLDGTFAKVPPGDMTPLILNVQGSLAVLAAGFLLWAARRQLRGGAHDVLPLRNVPARFGSLSRYGHWMTAVLVLVGIPMGQFVTVLPQGAPELDSFFAAHQSLGLTVLLLAAGRLLWLIFSPPPPVPGSALERNLARATHIGLYLLIIAFPASGALMMGSPINFYGLMLPGLATKPAPFWSSLHGLWLPLGFYIVIALHIGAALKHHFRDRMPEAIRRMAG